MFQNFRRREHVLNGRCEGLGGQEGWGGRRRGGEWWASESWGHTGRRKGLNLFRQVCSGFSLCQNLFENETIFKCLIYQ